MPNSSIPFRDTNYFSQLICDYIEGFSDLKPFYNRFPTLDNFDGQINEKLLSYNNTFRNTLVTSLMRQYGRVDISALTLTNIDLLKHDTTFTITTGHQLNLFTGPLYFFYKIISTINLCKELKRRHPKYNFVPVYWMATEDHDFDEINFFNFNGRKIQWTREASGAVGHLDLEGLDEVFEVFSNQLSSSENAERLKSLFRAAYIENGNLTDAMRYLVNELFKNEGLVIVDGDDVALKSIFQPIMKKEILENLSSKNVEETNNEINDLEANYKIQVNPRDINLFYIHKGIRERIIELDGIFHVNDSDLKWDDKGIIKELTENPERFSPNVIMRPVYQELILPNLCYIGGGGELAYWLQLKSTFKSYGITFPMLLLRNSVLLITEKHLEKLDKLNAKVEDLFLKNSDLLSTLTKRVSEIDINFSKQKEYLKEQFKDLYELARKTDDSFVGAVSAQERKQISGLENLERRLLKAQKRKLSDYLERATELQTELFPGGSLQERNGNFSEFYLAHGDGLKLKLLKNLNPLKQEFLVLEF